MITNLLACHNRGLLTAIATSPIASVISNPRLPLKPIVAVNDAFCALTGYCTDEILGRNCKFLAGPETEPWLTERIAAGSSPGRQSSRQFIDGNIDVMITVEDYLIDDHPSELLFSDEEAVICWTEGAFADGVTASQFLQARHAVAVFGQEQLPTITELHFDASGIDRQVANRVPSFAALPGAVVGTDRIATLHKRHAEFFSAIHPIRTHPLPIKGPVIREMMHWHKLRHNDSGLRWLMGLLSSEAKRLL